MSSGGHSLDGSSFTSRVCLINMGISVLSARAGVGAIRTLAEKMGRDSALKREGLEQQGRV